MNKNFKKKLIGGGVIAAVVICGVCAWQFFVPAQMGNQPAVFYKAVAGTGSTQIAADLKKQGLITNTFFFHVYAFITGASAKLQAGLYDISPNMSIAAIVGKLASGDVAKNRITILAGWDVRDMADYLEGKGFYTQKEFYEAVQADYSKEFDFLKTKSRHVSLEGYIFPDTYLVPVEISAKDFVRMTLNNFNKRLTPEMKNQITKDKRTVFQIVTMASILEKEVPSLEDKKIVAGILWKRLQNGMPLQVDSTVNYATGKSDARVTLIDTKFDSPYNTYKYYGLPLGPISSPGVDAITAAIYPTKTPYWFYLSASNGKTIYSKTFQEHSASAAKYLNS